ncbi:MAG TPA: tetratricopeptide repeat protein [Methylophilaceae bacterium]|nr:tetratricopeptide repeat protein [Methylophilaceae bacterium]
MKNSPHSMRRASLVLAILFASLGAQAQEAAPPPVEGLTSDFIFKYLVGEVAGQRGDIALASSVFFELAKSSRDPRLAERAARAAVYGNQQQLALRSAELWAELDPESVEAQQAMAQLLLSTGNLEDARPYLEKLLVANDTRANGFLYLNGVLSRHPDKDAALALVQDLAAPYPKQAEAKFAVAHMAFNAGQNELALKELAAAEALRPGWEPAAALHGEILLRESPDKALAFFQSFLKKYPETSNIRLTYAKLLVNEKKLDEARIQFTKLADGVKENPEMAVVVGLLAGQLGDYAQADKYFKQALEHGYKEPEQLYLYLGQSAEKQKQNDQAYAWYKQVTSDELRFDAQLRIASLLASEKKLDEARKMLQTLPNMTSEQQAVALQVEANLLVQEKQYDEAYAILDRAINTLPNTPEMIYDFAMLAEKVLRFDVMEQQLRKLITLKPDFAQAYNALGYTLADRNVRLDEAADLIEKALTLSPDDHYILDSMGWVQYRRGMLNEAAEYLRRAYSEKTDPEIAAHLGEVLWQQGKRDEAVKTWDEALRAHPDNEVLLNTTKKFRQ